MLPLWIVLIAVFFPFIAAQTVNRDVSAVVDATTSVVRLSADIKVAHATKEYLLSFPKAWAERLSFLSVSSNGKPLAVLPPTMSDNATFFAVPLQESSPTLKVVAVFSDLLELYPAAIAQNDNQLVRILGSHYFYSPYSTESQKLVLKVPSASIESFSKLQPFAVRGSSIHFGPYKDVSPFQTSPLQAHFVNNFPFAKLSSMQREVEVSHWGSIAVEDVYELKHAGAALKGGFSRFEYQLKRGAPSPSFRSLVASLPAQARDVYYRDQIGNISTSELRANKHGELDLEIQTRFPLFGGWQTQFYIGYAIPTELALFQDPANERFKLKVDFNTAFRNVWVEDMEMKVILPEGCTDIEVHSPYPAEESRAVRYTYLDSTLNGGRPVIILRARNLVEEHSKKVEISYRFPKTRMLVEPAMLIASVMLFFILCSAIARTTSMSSRKSFSDSTAKSE